MSHLLRATVGMMLVRVFLATRIALVDPAPGAELEDVDMSSLYGTCPKQNAVCVAIRMRNPKASDDCKVNCDADSVATRGVNLQPGVDTAFKDGCANCVAVDTQVGGKDATRHWAFDVIFPYDKITSKPISNGDVFTTVVSPTIEQAFGCAEPAGSCKSSAFFAYGASGSGKTYTMGFEPKNKDGMLQLSVKQIFNTLDRLKEQSSSLAGQSVYMAFFEIYGNDAGGSRVFDLFQKKRTSGEKGSQSQVMTGLVFKKVQSPEAAIQAFEKGNDLRRTAGTGMNAVSSRSHAVVQFFLSDKDISGISEKIRNGDSQRSRLLTMLTEATQVMFVDLAGSEPATKWEDATRQGEGKVINTGLTALRGCIAAAADPKQVCSSRADMLTEMLKNLFSKGKDGKAKAFTRMIATVNPSADPLQIEHTKSSMNYASTVKSIKIAAPKGNKAASMVKQMPEQIIAELRGQVAALGNRNEQLGADLKKCKEQNKSFDFTKSLSALNTSGVSNPAVEMVLSNSLQECEQQAEELGAELQISSSNLAAEKEVLKESVEQARDELQVKEEEINFCNAMLGESSTAEKLAKEQLTDARQREFALRAELEDVKYELKMLKEQALAAAADAEAVDQEKAAALVITRQARKRLELKEKQASICAQLKILQEVISYFDGGIGLEETLQQILEIDQQQEKRAQVIQDLQKEKLKGAQVNFMAWVGQKVADLSGYGNAMGPLQQRLMELDTAISLLQKATTDDDATRMTLQQTGEIKMKAYRKYLKEQIVNVEALKGASSQMLIDLLSEIHDEIRRAQKHLEMGLLNVAYELKSIENQAKSGLCLIRENYLFTAHGTCSEMMKEVASCNYFMEIDDDNKIRPRKVY
mmetsp:Transcript_97136/g.172996  ORF Transcript_97136/g.172996 Transcript_97136/m.172996 type:complete len:867 (-) Transcript_97136:14-2614(-)